MICIYQIQFPNGKRYIGQTNNFKKRMSTYKNCKHNKQIKVYNAIKKYGWENCIMTPISFCEEYLADTFETNLISWFNTTDVLGYNMESGGHKNKKFKHSEETKRKIGEANKDKIFSKERRNNISKGKTGIKVSNTEKMRIPKSKEHIEKIKIYMKGNKNRLGKTASEETKMKISESLRNYWSNRNKKN